MIETSAAIILLGFGVMFYSSHRRETNLSQIQWVISATRLRRDVLEQLGQTSEAEKATELADALSYGCGALALKVAISADRKIAAERAANEASGDAYLNLVGVTPGALNYGPTKTALYWLGSKMHSK